MTVRLADLPEKVQIAVDVSPLRIRHFTGISNLVARVLGHLLSAYPGRVKAFDSGLIISDEVIRQVLAERSGQLLSGDMKFDGSDRRFSTAIFDRSRTGANTTFIGLFGSVKTIRRAFQFEAQFIYDLTFLTVPEYHHADTVNFHGRTIEKDIETSDLLICISRATRDDVVTYLAVDAAKTAVICPGVEHDSSIAAQLNQFDRQAAPEPYFVVLGTIEPRKNIALILDLLKNRADVTAGMRAVFIGGDGWGSTFDDLVHDFGLYDMAQAGRILRVGYVTDLEREVLLRKAQFLIFPSWYEGFGLPVVEAMAVGCPVVASISTSVPEAGGDAAYYFDPVDVDSLAAAIGRMRRDLDADAGVVRSRTLAQAALFSWAKFGDAIDAAVSEGTARKWKLL